MSGSTSQPLLEDINTVKPYVHKISLYVNGSANDVLNMLDCILLLYIYIYI